MFGILMILAVISLSLRDMIVEERNNIRKRNDAIKNGNSYYLNENMDRIAVDSGLVYREGKINGCYCMYNPKNGSIYRNFTAERLKALQNKNLKFAIERGESRFIYDDRWRCECYEDGFAGAHWVDIKTGEIYVRREHDLSILWLNVTSGLFEGYAFGKDMIRNPERVIREINKEMTERGYVYHMNQKGKLHGFNVVYDDSRSTSYEC